MGTMLELHQQGHLGGFELFRVNPYCCIFSYYPYNLFFCIFSYYPHNLFFCIFELLLDSERFTIRMRI